MGVDARRLPGSLQQACGLESSARLTSTPVDRGECKAGLIAATILLAIDVLDKELSEWLGQHERDCTENVEMWMVRSLPVPTGVIVECWPDPAWRRAFENAVVGPVVGTGVDRDLTGFLRGADRARGAGIVTPDGETVWSAAPAVGVPHPVLIPDLDDLRDFATELQVDQAIPQLYRETWTAAPGECEGDRVDEFSGGRFAELRLATSRCRALGYAVTGGSAVTRIWERGRLVEARYWIGNDAPDDDAVTGDLIWVAAGGRQLPLTEVGPVAYSEGMRMAALVHAGRSPDSDDEQ